MLLTLIRLTINIVDYSDTLISGQNFGWIWKHSLLQKLSSMVGYQSSATKSRGLIITLKLIMLTINTDCQL